MPGQLGELGERRLGPDPELPDDGERRLAPGAQPEELVLIVISGTLGIFLLRQYKFAKTELDALTPAATQLISDYTNNYAMTQDFLKKLAEYGRTHQDFGPIVAKYHLDDALPKPGTTSPTNSLPASATSKK
jgi:hypothetical protein